MKRTMKSSRPFRALLVAGLLAMPLLASNALAQGTEDNGWSPQDVFTDASGTNSYAYWGDPNNWGFGVPAFTDPNSGNYERIIINGQVGSYVACVITNDVQMEQLIMGDSGSGAGILIITNGAQVTAGIGVGQWTGVGFPNGPATLYIGTNCSFTIGSHLWVGQGTNNGNPAVGTVIVDGGTLDIPYGQLGVGWNGKGGTNFITFTNGGKMFLDTWASSTLGLPGNNSLGIMNLADDGCLVVVTNNQTGYFPTLVANNQLLAYGGRGTISWNYNPVANITTISATPPFEVGKTPVFSVEPTNTIVAAGNSATLSVTMSNNMACNFQWMFNNAPLTDGNGISGSQTATLTIASVGPATVGQYSVQATNSSDHGFFASSTVAAVSSEAINLYPVVTINGIITDVYEVDYTTSLTPPVTWTPLTTVTLGAATQYVVDTSSPMSVKRFYRVVQH